MHILKMRLVNCLNRYPKESEKTSLYVRRIHRNI